MATLPASLRDHFPRFHQVCDHCGCAASWAAGQASLCERTTVAGTFRYQLCYACIEKVEAMPRARRDRAYLNAMVRHAWHYSPQFGAFVAAWFGISIPKIKANQEAA